MKEQAVVVDDFVAAGSFRFPNRSTRRNKTAALIET